MGNFISDFKDKVTNTVSDAGNAIKGVSSQVLSPLEGTPLWGLTYGNIGGIVDGITSNVNGVLNLPDDVLQGLGGLLGGGQGGGGGGAGYYAPESLKRLADYSANYAMNQPGEYTYYEGQRFFDPSQLTQQAEYSIANQGMAGSQVQGAYDLASQLTQAAQNSQFGTSLSGPQTFSPAQTQEGVNYTNAVGAQARDYTGQNVTAANTMGPQTFNANTYNNASAGTTPERYGGQTFESQTYQGAPIQNARQDYDYQNFQGQTYGNATEGLTKNAKDYQSGNTFAQDVGQYMNPYNESVLQGGIEDLNRARLLANQSTNASAHAAGAFGGSRHALQEAENTANFYKNVGDLSNQIRSQGYNQAAQMAAQDRSQRLGLTAESDQASQQLGVQGALQGQSLTAGDLQAARDATLRSQLQSQQLGSAANLQTQNLAAQAGMQGQQLTADSYRQAQQLMAQSGMQGQELTAQSRNLMNQLLNQGALQGQQLGAQSDLQSQQLGAQSYNQAADRSLQAGLNAQNLGMQSDLQAQQLGANSYNQMQQLMAQGALQGQQLGANAYQNAMDNNLAAQLQAQRLGADSFNAQQDRLLNYANLEEQYRQSALNNALTGAGMMGDMGQALDSTYRQQLFDQLQMGQNQDTRGQQQLDFDYNQWQAAQDYPMEYVQMLNTASQPGQSLVYKPNPTGGGGQQKSNPLGGILGGALSGFMATGSPWGALAGAGMGLIGGGASSNAAFAGLGALGNYLGGGGGGGVYGPEAGMYDGGDYLGYGY